MIGMTGEYVWQVRYTAMWMTEEGELRPFLSTGYDAPHQICKEYATKDELVAAVEATGHISRFVILEHWAKEYVWGDE